MASSRGGLKRVVVVLAALCIHISAVLEQYLKNLIVAFSRGGLKRVVVVVAALCIYISAIFE